MADDLLDCFLSAAAEEFEESIVPKPKDLSEQNEDAVFLSSISNFEQEIVINKNKQQSSLSLKKDKKASSVHKGDTDSSDDEENRVCQNGKYNECGKSIKHLLESPVSSYSSSSIQSTWKTKRPVPTANSTLTMNSSNLHPTKVSIKPVAENPAKQLAVPVKPDVHIDVYTDPIFGIRITKPLISHTTLKERMQGRTAVPMVRLKRYVELLKKDNDWVVAGVLVQKTGKTSQKGSPFSIWCLSDLHNDLKTVTLFLFGSAYKELWKYAIGTVIGVLNPNIFEKKAGSKDEACLSVDNFQRVMIFGQSKDLGTCKSIKKDGQQCHAFVNINKCEYCIYHIKQEYQKCSKRSELQSNFAGQGLNALRNKVLGKNEVFYAGKSFMAIPAGKSKKLQAKDQGRLSLLSGAMCNTNSTIKTANKESAVIKKLAVHVELSKNQKRKDLELLKKLGLSHTDTNKTPNLLAKQSNSVTIPELKNSIPKVHVEYSGEDKFGSFKAKKGEKSVQESVDPVFNFLDPNNLSDIEYDLSDTEIEALVAEKESPNKIKMQKQSAKKIEMSKPNPVITKPERSLSQAISIALQGPQIANPLTGPMDIPLLSGLGNTMVDLSSPIQKRHIDRAKVNAMKWVQRNGPIQKCDPNSNKDKGKKRALENETVSDAKKQKIQDSEHFSERFKKMMAATSKHTDLVEKHDNEEAEKYFNKLEMKEKMEEKMLNTFKIACKAVRCLQCKYTSFSASDSCKKDRHPLKVFDAVKRFFKCGNCGNRTVSLDVVPLLSCKNCGSGKWERSSMIREQKAVSTHSLSIRGGEQKYGNSVATDSNINLLVPDSGT